MTRIPPIIFLLIFLCTSCVRNQISLAFDKEFLESQKTSTEAINVIIEDHSANHSNLGYQYLFFFIPFGKNTLIDQNTNIPNSFNQILSEHGFHISNNEPSSFTAKLIINKLSANVYDYFFLRKLSCTAELKIELFSSQGMIASGKSNQSYSSLEKFAFAPEINSCLNLVFEQAANESLYKLNLKYLNSAFN